MRNVLFERKFEINTSYGTFPIKFVAPTWAKGFRCLAGSCGLCCLSALPETVPKKHFQLLDTTICHFYDYSKKICNKYDQRPWACRTYPFIFGVEDEIVNVSANLSCPATNDERDIELDELRKTFSDPTVERSIEWLRLLYKATKESELWMEADKVWKIVSRKVEKYFNSLSAFPLLSELQSLALNTVDERLGIPRSERQHPEIPPMTRLVEETAKIYVATTFRSCKVCRIRTRGAKMYFVLFDPSTEKVTKVKTRTPTKTPQLEIDKRSRQLLADYASLIVRRPFLSLAAVSSELFHQAIPIGSVDHLIGAFVPLEVGAAVVASRDSLSEVNQEAMRESISFAEECVLGQFRSPDRALFRRMQSR